MNTFTPQVKFIKEKTLKKLERSINKWLTSNSIAKDSLGHPLLKVSYKNTTALIEYVEFEYESII